MSFAVRTADITFLSAFLRLLIAIVAGGVIGYGRSKRERDAGLRTYILISIGSAMSVLITLYEYQMLHTSWADAFESSGAKFDASRMAAQMIAGIGFLGAGIIIKTLHQQVRGLTTATGLFLAVCIGIAAGIGFYEVVLLAVILTILILNVLSGIDASFKRRLRNMTISIEYFSPEDLEMITQAILNHHAQIFDIELEQSMTDSWGQSASFILKLPKENRSHSELLTTVAELPCVVSVQEIIA